MLSNIYIEALSNCEVDGTCKVLGGCEGCEGIVNIFECSGGEAITTGPDNDKAMPGTGCCANC